MLNTKTRDEFDRPTLSIIDRKKNLVEIYRDGDSVWIGVDKLEKEIYSLSPLVQQLCLVADRNAPGMIAIVVPSKENITEVDILSSFRDLANRHNLKVFEVPVAVILRSSAWGADSNCVSSSGKLLRGPIQAAYQEQIEKLYATLERGQRPLTEVKTDPGNIVSDILFALVQKLHARPESTPQDTSCADFLDFQFKGPTEEVTNKLNQYLSLMIEDVKAIRNESAIWRTESKQQEEAATQTTNLQVQKLNQIADAKVEETLRALSNLSDSAEVLQVIKSLCDTFSHRLCSFSTLYHDLKEIESLQHPRHKEVTERYGRTLQDNMKYAERYSVRVPYQIWAAGWWRAPGSTEDPANMLTTPLGTAEVYCSISGERIEKDVTDIGVERWHCIDLQSVDHSITSHEQLRRLRELIRSKFSNNIENIQESLDLLNRIDPNENCEWIKETAHFWHLRTSIDVEDDISPGEFFKNACRSYNHRPALGIPNPNEITHPLVPQHSSPLASAMNMEFTSSCGYLWLSYTQIYSLALSVAHVLQSLPGVENGAAIGICGFNNIEWAICDFACSLLGCVSVGLYIQVFLLIF